MRFLLASVCLIIIAGVYNVEGLKCYVCATCSDMGTSTTCATSDTRCTTSELSDVVTKGCATAAICATNHANADITATREYECCNTDDCNNSSGVQHLPSLLLLILPAIIASFFKN